MEAPSQRPPLMDQESAFLQAIVEAPEDGWAEPARLNELASSPHLERLSELDLTARYATGQEQALEALARSTRLTRLRALSLRRYGLHWSALAAAPWLGQLTMLSLSGG